VLPILKYPGVYVEALPIAVHRIVGVVTPVPAFVGWAPLGPVHQATLVRSWLDYQVQFGGWGYLGNAVKGFFENGGQQLYVVRVVTTPPLQGDADLAALLQAALQNIPLRWRHP